jgi:hypothetical protein
MGVLGGKSVCVWEGGTAQDRITYPDRPCVWRTKTRQNGAWRRAARSSQGWWGGLAVLVAGGDRKSGGGRERGRVYEGFRGVSGMFSPRFFVHFRGGKGPGWFCWASGGKMVWH